MEKKRSLNRTEKVRVKTLFDHRCAVCKEPGHEIHHIDGNPGNNKDENLIFLCANCHKRCDPSQGILIHPSELRAYRIQKLLEKEHSDTAEKETSELLSPNNINDIFSDHARAEKEVYGNILLEGIDLYSLPIKLETESHIDFPDFIDGKVIPETTLIEGDSGCGKTTLLLRILQDNSHEYGKAYLNLNLYSGETDPDSILPNIISTENKFLSKILLCQGLVLWLLDGINEIPLEKRADFILLYQNLRREYPKCKIISTSRTNGWRGDGKLYFSSKLLVKQLNFEDKKYFFSRTIPNHSSKAIEMLKEYKYLDEITNNHIFLVIFSWLAKKEIFTNISYSNSESPIEILLVSEFHNAYLREWEAKKNVVNKLTPTAITEILEILAAKALNNKSLNFTLEYFETLLGERFGCAQANELLSHFRELIFIQNNEVRGFFSHQRFLNYFAGRWLCKTMDIERDNAFSKFSDPWWNEAVLIAMHLNPKRLDWLDKCIETGNITAISWALEGKYSKECQEYVRNKIKDIFDQFDCAKCVFFLRAFRNIVFWSRWDVETYLGLIDNFVSAKLNQDTDYSYYPNQQEIAFLNLTQEQHELFNNFALRTNFGKKLADKSDLKYILRIKLKCKYSITIWLDLIETFYMDRDFDDDQIDKMIVDVLIDHYFQFAKTLYFRWSHAFLTAAIKVGPTEKIKKFLVQANQTKSGLDLDIYSLAKDWGILDVDISWNAASELKYILDDDKSDSELKFISELEIDKSDMAWDFCDKLFEHDLLSDRAWEAFNNLSKIEKRKFFLLAMSAQNISIDWASDFIFKEAVKVIDMEITKKFVAFFKRDFKKMRLQDKITIKIRICYAIAWLPEKYFKHLRPEIKSSELSEPLHFLYMFSIWLRKRKNNYKVKDISEHHFKYSISDESLSTIFSILKEADQVFLIYEERKSRIGNTKTACDDLLQFIIDEGINSKIRLYCVNELKKISKNDSLDSRRSIKLLGKLGLVDDISLVKQFLTGDPQNDAFIKDTIQLINLRKN